MPAASAPMTTTTDPSSVRVPLDFAVLKEMKKGSQDKLIIHIQDAHTNLSGQENLAAALDALMSSRKVELVLSEGGTGDCSLTTLKEQASPQVWKRVAKKHLVQGNISGEEYLNLTSDHSMKIIGIEDMTLYFKTIQSYAKLAEKRETVLNYLKDVRSKVEKIKKRIYPQDLLDHEKEAVEQIRNEYEKNNGDRLKNLMHFLAAENIDFSSAPNASDLKSMLEKEKQIDFDAANLQQASLLEKLQGKDAEWVRQFTAKSEKAKQQMTSRFLLLKELQASAVQNGINLSEYPELAKYSSYLEQFTQINLEQMLGELKGLEEKLYDKKLVNPDAKLVRAIDRYLNLLDNAYQIRMTSDEFQVFKVNVSDFQAAAYLGFLNRQLAEQGYFDDFLTPSADMAQAEAFLREFYESVAERDQIFIQNIEKTLAQENKREAVLITGGYHTTHLKELFNERGYSYVVLTPYVNSETNQKKYERLLLEPLKNSSASGTQKWINKKDQGETARPIATALDGARLAALADDAGVKNFQSLGARLAEDTEISNILTRLPVLLKRANSYFFPGESEINREQIISDITRLRDDAERVIGGLKGSPKQIKYMQDLIGKANTFLSKQSGARLAGETVRLHHITSIDSLKSIMENGFYNGVGVKTFQRADYPEYPARDSANKVVIVFDAPLNIVENRIRENGTYSLNAGSQIPDTQLEVLKKQLGDKNFEKMMRLSGGKIGHLPAVRVNRPETLRVNKERFEKGKMTPGAHKKMLEILSGARLTEDESKVLKIRDFDDLRTEMKRAKDFVSQIDEKLDADEEGNSRVFAHPSLKYQTVHKWQTVKWQLELSDDESASEQTRALMIVQAKYGTEAFAEAMDMVTKYLKTGEVKLPTNYEQMLSYNNILADIHNSVRKALEDKMKDGTATINLEEIRSAEKIHQLAKELQNQWERVYQAADTRLAGARLTRDENGIRAHFLERLNGLIQKANTNRDLKKKAAIRKQLIFDLEEIKKDLIAVKADDNDGLFKALRRLKGAVERIPNTNFHLEATYVVKRIQERSVPPELMAELRRTSQTRKLDTKKLDAILNANYGIDLEALQALLRRAPLSEASLFQWSAVSYPSFRKEFLANRESANYVLDSLVKNENDRFLGSGVQEHHVTPVMWARLFHHVGVFYGKIGAEKSGARLSLFQNLKPVRYNASTKTTAFSRSGLPWVVKMSRAPEGFSVKDKLGLTIAEEYGGGLFTETFFWPEEGVIVSRKLTPLLTSLENSLSILTALFEIGKSLDKKQREVRAENMRLLTGYIKAYVNFHRQLWRRGLWDFDNAIYDVGVDKDRRIKAWDTDTLRFYPRNQKELERDYPNVESMDVFKKRVAERVEEMVTMDRSILEMRLVENGVGQQLKKAVLAYFDYAVNDPVNGLHMDALESDMASKSHRHYRMRISESEIERAKKDILSGARLSSDFIEKDLQGLEGKFFEGMSSDVAAGVAAYLKSFAAPTDILVGLNFLPEGRVQAAAGPEREDLKTGHTELFIAAGLTAQTKHISLTLRSDGSQITGLAIASYFETLNPAIMDDTIMAARFIAEALSINQPESITNLHVTVWAPAFGMPSVDLKELAEQKMTGEYAGARLAAADWIPAISAAVAAFTILKGLLWVVGDSRRRDAVRHLKNASSVLSEGSWWSLAKYPQRDRVRAEIENLIKGLQVKQKDYARLYAESIQLASFLAAGPKPESPKESQKLLRKNLGFGFQPSITRLGRWASREDSFEKFVNYFAAAHGEISKLYYANASIRDRVAGARLTKTITSLSRVEYKNLIARNLNKLKTGIQSHNHSKTTLEDRATARPMYVEYYVPGAIVLSVSNHSSIMKNNDVDISEFQITVNMATGEILPLDTEIINALKQDPIVTRLVLHDSIRHYNASLGARLATDGMDELFELAEDEWDAYRRPQIRDKEAFQKRLDALDNRARELSRLRENDPDQFRTWIELYRSELEKGNDRAGVMYFVIAAHYPKLLEEYERTGSLPASPDILSKPKSSTSASLIAITQIRIPTPDNRTTPIPVSGYSDGSIQMEMVSVIQQAAMGDTTKPFRVEPFTISGSDILSSKITRITFGRHYSKGGNNKVKVEDKTVLFPLDPSNVVASRMQGSLEFEVTGKNSYKVYYAPNPTSNIVEISDKEMVGRTEITDLNYSGARLATDISEADLLDDQELPQLSFTEDEIHAIRHDLYNKLGTIAMSIMILEMMGRIDTSDIFDSIRTINQQDGMLLANIKTADTNEELRMALLAIRDYMTIERFEGAVRIIDQRMDLPTSKGTEPIGEEEIDINVVDGETEERIETRDEFVRNVEGYIVQVRRFIDTALMGAVREEFDIRKVVNQVVESQARERILTIDYEIPDGQIMDSYGILLDRVLTNLVKNAREATEENTGRINVRVFIVSDEFVQIEVADNGVGMNEETLKKIWDFGFRAEEKIKKGAEMHDVVSEQRGIGLASVKALTADLGGVIKVNSVKKDDNHGTVFGILLPLRVVSSTAISGNLQLPKEVEFKSGDPEKTIKVHFGARLSATAPSLEPQDWTDKFISKNNLEDRNLVRAIQTLAIVFRANGMVSYDDVTNNILESYKNFKEKTKDDLVAAILTLAESRFEEDTFITSMILKGDKDFSHLHPVILAILAHGLARSHDGDLSALKNIYRERKRDDIDPFIFAVIAAAALRHDLKTGEHPIKDAVDSAFFEFNHEFELTHNELEAAVRLMIKSDMTRDQQEMFNDSSNIMRDSKNSSSIEPVTQLFLAGATAWESNEDTRMDDIIAQQKEILKLYKSLLNPKTKADSAHLIAASADLPSDRKFVPLNGFTSKPVEKPIFDNLSVSEKNLLAQLAAHAADALKTDKYFEIRGGSLKYLSRIRAEKNTDGVVLIFNSEDLEIYRYLVPQSDIQSISNSGVLPASESELSELLEIVARKQQLTRAVARAGSGIPSELLDSSRHVTALYLVDDYFGDAFEKVDFASKFSEMGHSIDANFAVRFARKDKSGAYVLEDGESLPENTQLVIIGDASAENKAYATTLKGRFVAIQPQSNKGNYSVFADDAIMRLSMIIGRIKVQEGESRTISGLDTLWQAIATFLTLEGRDKFKAAPQKYVAAMLDPSDSSVDLRDISLPELAKLALDKILSLMGLQLKTVETSA